MDGDPRPFDEDAPQDDDVNDVMCFGCVGPVSVSMEVMVSEPCPDVLGRIHFWHWTCFVCHKMHGAMPKQGPCTPEDDE